MANSMGQRIKYIRELRGLSQSELASQTHISKGTISTLEREPDLNITIKHLMDVCKTLQVSTEYILYGSDSVEHNDEWRRIMNTKEGVGLRQTILNFHKKKQLAEVLLAIANLSKRDLEIVLNLAKSLKASKHG
jgi:transcriptional regulator with XRE-family HTH domain